jgi:hypothetical protein
MKRQMANAVQDQRRGGPVYIVAPAYVDQF